MLIFAKSIDDFKTDRKGISPPLPIYLRIVPLVFYMTIGASILLNGLFFVRYSQAGRNKEVATLREKNLQADLSAAKSQRKDLENETKRASDIQTWLDASRPLQPLIVAIARSIEMDSSIVELRLDRDSDNPAQIRISMRLGSDTTRQLDLTLAKIADLRFRTFSPQQSLAKGEIDYKATLIWLDAAPEQVEPSSSGP
ncbi:MAG: hypothetical protein ACOYMS_01070 [Terrimicrobiaceae bacterium]